MSKILPRGQPPLRRQREVSGSSKVDKGAPRSVPAGLPQGMVRFPPRPPVMSGWSSGRHGCLGWVVQRSYKSVSKHTGFVLEGSSQQPSQVPLLPCLQALLVAQAWEGVWNP